MRLFPSSPITMDSALCLVEATPKLITDQCEKRHESRMVLTSVLCGTALFHSPSQAVFLNGSFCQSSRLTFLFRNLA